MKKKIMIITAVAIILALAATGTAFASNGYSEGTGLPLEAANGNGNGRSSERETGQKFAVQAEMYETQEEFHQAVLAQKFEIIDAKEADGSLSSEDAKTIRDHLTACDGTCETEGENSNRPEDGWGIFGNDGSGAGKRGTGNQGAGQLGGECEEDGEPLRDGSGSDNASGNRHGKNN